MNSLIIAAAIVLLAGLLYFAKKESTPGLLATKPFLSLLFIVAAMVQPHGDLSYFHFVLAGLALCLVGDVCLIFFASRKIFTAGLVAFLAGHVLYVLAFLKYAAPGPVLWVTAPICLVLSMGVFLWLKPHLGTMLGPVIAYIVIISAMTISAAALKSSPRLDSAAGTLVFAGALLFYASDIFVARHRFVNKEFLNRLVGLPLYYAGQFMIAFSTGMI